MTSRFVICRNVCLNAIIAVACKSVDDTVKFVFNSFICWMASCSASHEEWKANKPMQKQAHTEQNANGSSFWLKQRQQQQRELSADTFALCGRAAQHCCCYHRCCRRRRRRCCCAAAAAVQQKGQMVFKQIKQIANYSCYLSLIIGSFFILSLHISLLLQRYALHFHSMPSHCAAKCICCLQKRLALSSIICSLFVSCLFHVCFVSFDCLWLWFVLLHIA